MAAQTDIRETQLAQFTAGYIEALYWSSTDVEEDGETINIDQFEASTQAGDHCRAACREFFEANYADIVAATEQQRGYSFEHAGHDFALTRNRHGAGYWDRGLKDTGRRLTEAAHNAGDCWPYIGDDGLIYIS